MDETEVAGNISMENGIPPKQLKLSALPKREEAARPAGNTLRTMSRIPAPAAAKPAAQSVQESKSRQDSLPVLQAFQEFVETERNHARKRLLAMSFLAFVLLLAVCGCAVFAIVVLQKRFTTDFSVMQGKVIQLSQDTLKLRNEATGELNKLRQDTETFRQNIEAGTSTVESTKSELLASLATQKNDIDEIRRLLNDMKKEADARRAEAEKKTVAPPVRQPAEVKAPAKSMEFAITPKGADRPVMFRMPISE
jgi:methyl-accepting chemotaxis protein